MIWLIGMMGSGKSTVGKALAERLGLPMWDSDEEVESACGMSVRELWQAEGEAALRAAESAVVQRLAANAEGVVATGGGVVLDPANVAAMQQSGTVVWLRAEPEALATRISGNARPLLDGVDVVGRLAEILDARREIYSGAADITVDTEQLRVSEVVAAVTGSLE